MMDDMEKHEMRTLRTELKNVVEKNVEQEVEIMRLGIKIKHLNTLCGIKASELTESEFGSLTFPGNGLNPKNVADNLITAIENNLHDIRSKIKEVL